MNEDVSEWTGWEMQVRTESRDIFIILLRRKYIPPLMELYQDLAFVLHGAEGFIELEDETIKQKKSKTLEDSFSPSSGDEDDETDEERLKRLINTLYHEK